MKSGSSEVTDFTMQSLPSRERGLKLKRLTMVRLTVLVAPFAGAWIEIYLFRSYQCRITVAPFAGAWIEISDDKRIEIGLSGRSLRGSVD